MEQELWAHGTALLMGGTFGLDTPACGEGRGPKCSLVAVRISCVSSVTENLEITSDFHRSKSLRYVYQLALCQGELLARMAGGGDKKFKLPPIHHKTKCAVVGRGGDRLTSESEIMP